MSHYRYDIHLFCFKLTCQRPECYVGLKESIKNCQVLVNVGVSGYMLSFSTLISYLQFLPTPLHFVMYSAHTHSPPYSLCAGRISCAHFLPILHIWQIRIRKMNCKCGNWHHSVCHSFPMLSQTTIAILHIALPSASAVCEKNRMSFMCVLFAQKNTQKET